MGAREELTSILRDAAEAAIAGGLPVLTYEGYADAAVMAGWRPPPRVSRLVTLSPSLPAIQFRRHRSVCTTGGMAAYLRDLGDEPAHRKWTVQSTTGITLD